MNGIKAKEFEDLPQPKRIARRASQISLSKEVDEIAKRTGVLWECIGRRADKEGGYLYSFKLKITDEAEVEQLIDAHFPALEPRGSSRRIRQFDDDLKRLGYGSKENQEGVFLELPDAEALSRRWEKNHPGLEILSSEGVADDRTFIEAFFTHDLLISNGKEFVHDHIFHVVPYLTDRFIFGPLVNRCKTKLVKRVAKEYKAVIMGKDKRGEVILAAFVDIITALSVVETLLIESKEITEVILERNPRWTVYFRRRFGDPEFEFSQPEEESKSDGALPN